MRIRENTKTLLLVLGAVSITCAVFSWLAFRYYPFFADDALISLRYAERLLEGKGLTWTDGQRVEGYSNLLWTVAVAFGGLFHSDLIAVARLLGLGAFFLLFGITIHFGRALVERSLIPGIGAALLIATSSVAAVWAIGGLEQPFVALFLTLTLFFLNRLLEADGASRPGGTSRRDADGRRVLLYGLPLALLALTRPEGPMFAAVAAGALLLVRGIRIAGLFILPATAVTVLHYLGRYLYYGDWFPNTAYVKVHFGTARLESGLSYLADGVDCLYPVLFFAAFGVIAGAAGHLRRLAFTTLAMLIVWVGYLVFIGGDIFPAYRHFVPILVTGAILAAIGFDWLISVGTEGRLAIRLGLVCIVLLTGGVQYRIQRDQKDFRRARFERWEWDGEVVGTLFRKGFAEAAPRIATTASGCIPYFSRLPALDLFGLCDRHIARTVPAVPGTLAHDHGDGVYALDLKPDIIVMDVAGGALRYRSGREMATDPRFHRHYMPVAFEGYTPHRFRTVPFVRIDGPIGVRSGKDAVIYPAYLLEGEGVTGILDPEGRMAAYIPADKTLRSRRIRLPAGRWRFSVTPLLPELTVHATYHPTPIAEATWIGPDILLAASGEVSLVIDTGGVEGILREVRFERIPEKGQADSRRQLETGTRHRIYSSKTGDSAVPVTPVKRIGSFDKAEGWRCSGQCGGWITTGKRPGQAMLIGASGKLVNTFHPRLRDAAKGVFTSPAFAVPQDAVLGFRMGGGQEKVGMRAVVDGATVLVWRSPKVGETLHQIYVDFSPFAGKRVRLEIFDQSDGPWGHVLVDEIALYRKK